MIIMMLAIRRGLAVLLEKTLLLLLSETAAGLDGVALGLIVVDFAVLMLLVVIVVVVGRILDHRS